MIGDILQPTHLLFVLVIALIVLGPKRLPEVGRSLGRGLRDFRSAISGQDQDQPQEMVQQLQGGEAPVAPSEQAVTTAAPEQATATAAPPEQATTTAAPPEQAATPAAPPEQPAPVSAAQAAPPQEPASVPAEHGSTGSA